MPNPSPLGRTDISITRVEFDAWASGDDGTFACGDPDSVASFAGSAAGE